MSDKLVFDLAQEVEGTPNVFIRKDWINILDNQNQNYNNNQSVIDTSQLSNSNKYMSYREAYFVMPLLLTLVSDVNGGFLPATDDPADSAIGLKNWFGQIIHSFTLDYNGTTIVQQTPYINMWNSFKLMTSMSYNDILTQGSTIGFYPDSATTWSWTPALAATEDVVGAGSYSRSGCGQGVCNNFNAGCGTISKNLSTEFTQMSLGTGNTGFAMRQSYINYDACITTDGTVQPYDEVKYPVAYSDLLASSECSLLWKSHVFNKINSGAGQAGILQIAVNGIVYLKHIHSFFNMCPLLKGVFMKMTMNLNNTTTTFSAGRSSNVTDADRGTFIAATSIANPIGGVNPGMVASVKPTIIDRGGGDLVYANGSVNLLPTVNAVNTQQNYKFNVSVGGRVLDGSIASLTGVQSTTMAQSVYLYIPAYTFNPVFEQAYLSSPVKQIKYTDVYQYQVLNVPAGSQFNNLLTNGIANVKSVLILPYFSNASQFGSTTCVYNTNVSASLSNNSGFLAGVPVWQSPFDPAGTGPTSPLVLLKNFNIQVSGQNAIYNIEKYPFEQFNNQLYGANAVNGGLTDGITSGLIDRQAFDMEYCYYYVNVERMLPVEMSVPKSIQILGTNSSKKAVDLYCFIEYGNEISIDILTGARV